jgi:hypothetical protein
MKFIPITMDAYVRQHLENYPETNERNLRHRLETALTAFRSGITCDCGNDIWVIGSASVGNSCVTCITGESSLNEYLEISDALPKRERAEGRRHIDDIPPGQIAGFFSDDGYEIDMNLVQKPSLCLTCIHNNDPGEEILCNLTRYDQRNQKEFKCFAYKRL